MYYNRLNSNMLWGRISNSNNIAIVDDWIQVTDTGCVVKKAFLSKKPKCCAENLEIIRYRGWNFLPENQISRNLRYYENIKVIKIIEIIAYIKWIYAAYLIFAFGVKPWPRKEELLANKKGKSMQ